MTLPLAIVEDHQPPRVPVEVDEQAAVIKGVKFLGFISANNARGLGLPEDEFGEALDQPYLYDAADAHEALAQYDQLPIYEDHDREAKSGRKTRELIGQTANPTIREDGIYGEVHYLTEREGGRALAEVARRFPKRLGCSHVAEGFPVLREGRIVVTKYRPRSVDIVTQPATTAGLFEDRGNTMPAKKKRTVKEAVAKAKDSELKRLFLEMEDMDMEGEVSDERTPEDVIRDGLIDAISRKLAEASDDQIKEVMTVLGLGEPLGGGDDAGTDSPAEATAAEESLRTKLATAEAKALLLESHRAATSVRVQAVAAAAANGRKALVESWPKDLVPQAGGSSRPDGITVDFEESSDVDPAYAARWQESLR